MPGLNILKLPEGWDCPARIPERREGDYRIKRFKKEAGVYRLHKQIGDYDYFKLLRDGQITILQEQRDGVWNDWMTDDPLFWYAMKNIAQRSKGKVLVVGLGLGLILRHLTDQSRVSWITVVERSREVVDLVWPTLTQHLSTSHMGCEFELIGGDFFAPQTFETSYLSGDFDTVITDLWVGSPDEPEVQELFLRTYDMVNAYWPDAEQLYHGVQPWANLLDTFKHIGNYDQLRTEQKLGILARDAERSMRMQGVIT